VEVTNSSRQIPISAKAKNSALQKFTEPSNTQKHNIAARILSRETFGQRTLRSFFSYNKISQPPDLPLTMDTCQLEGQKPSYEKLGEIGEDRDVRDLIFSSSCCLAFWQLLSCRIALTRSASPATSRQTLMSCSRGSLPALNAT
jgi:hypothetical protein